MSGTAHGPPAERYRLLSRRVVDTAVDDVALGLLTQRVDAAGEGTQLAAD